MENLTFFSASEEDTESFGYQLAEKLKAQGLSYAFIALYGEMGVGKTAFTRGFCRALGISAVHSPTYTVVNEYKGDTLSIFHFDLYRLEDEDDLYSIGFDDYLAREGLILCEWTEKIPEIVPNDAISVLIRRTKACESEREIEISFPDSLALSL